jgi:Predicted integral membrane protein
MSDLFNMDNAFFRIMTKSMQILYLNLLWILFSIPIFTIGASTTALHTITLKMVRNEEGYIFADFKKAFKENFKQATAIWLLVITALIILLGDIYYFAQWKNSMAIVAMGVFLFGVLVVVLTMLFVFHLQAYYENTTKLTLLNSFELSIRHLPTSVALLILAICMIYGIYVSVVLMIIATLVGISLFSYVSSYLIRRIFD